MQVDPGKLDKKIKIILRTSGGQDDAGFDVDEPNEVVIRECYAQVTNTSGKELIEGGRELSEAKKRFLVRYTKKKITTQMIIKYAGDEYDIQYVNRWQEHNDYIEIWAELRSV